MSQRNKKSGSNDVPLNHASARLLRFLGLIFLGAGILISTSNFLNGLGLRPVISCFIIIGLMMLLAIRTRKIRVAAWLMCGGLLVVAFVGAFMNRGIHSLSWIVMPISTMAAGVLISRRAALSLAAASALGVLSLYWLHLHGHAFITEVPPHVATYSVIVAGSISAIIGADIADIFRDQMSLLQDSRKELYESEELFRRLFEDSGQPTMLLNSDATVIKANRSALAMFRVSRLEQVQGRTLGSFSQERQPDGESSAKKSAYLVRQAFVLGSIDFEWVHLRADNQPFTARILGTTIRHDKQNLLHMVWEDITAEKKAREQIEFLAFHDTLTGLPNRTLGQDRLQHAIASAGRNSARLGVLCLDLDKFKHVNDAYGHEIGDHLLKRVAERMTRCLRSDDTLCRLSGDEFMIVLPELQSESQLSRVCERILDCLANPIEIKGVQVITSFSIGAAVYPLHGNDSSDLMRNADIALYEAKKSGRRTYRFFQQQMNVNLLHYLEIRDALRLALERREFELHYQPQIDLQTDRVMGVEALIRWNRPGHARVAPGIFIGIAEESGLIVQIGRWVLHEACRQAAAWHAQGWTNLVMAVNLSAVQFSQGRPEQDVLEALEQSGLNPAQLELELTESMLLENDTALLKTVNLWKERGIQLSIDDFGTGYSSLAYLKRLSVDKLKIDRSFVANLLKDEQDQAIVGAMIQMAQKLGLTTIAEGIEDAVVAEQLKIMGCDQVQGYLYAKPLPPGEMEQWLKAHSGMSVQDEQLTSAIPG